MKTFFLPLILSLITGCELSDKVKGCAGGWVEFTCQYPATKENYDAIEQVNPKKTTFRSTKKNEWENDGTVSLYHNTRDRTLRVAINQLQDDDFGDYKCKFPEGSKKKVTLKVAGGDWCQETFNQTAYRTAKTTITCVNKGSNLKSKVRFLCKENGTTCDDIYSTSPSAKSKSNGAFTGTEPDDISVSISNVSSQHAGVYWCGVESNKGHYRTALRRIQLEVKDTITNFTRSPTIGQNLAYWCQYPNEEPEEKFICKGEDPSICQQLVSTQHMDAGKFSMKEDKTNITITMTAVKTEDSGTYWCGAKSARPKKESNSFFHRVLVTVGPVTTKTTAAPESYDDDGHRKPFIQTAYRTAKTTITCALSGTNHRPNVIFFCKENGQICEDILSSSVKSNGTFTLTDTDTGFNVSISNVSSQDAGVYWCGIESNTKTGCNRTAVSSIQLEVKDTITTFTKSPTIGQNLTYWCQYPNEEPEKFICKGEDPSICQQLVSTQHMDAGKFSMKEDKLKRNITITIRDVTTEDSGTYWCGAESSDPTTKSPSFFHRGLVTVVPPTTSTPVATANGDSAFIAVVVCAVVLALVLILVLLYKRFKCSKNAGNGDAQNAKEDRFYEEIQERPQKAEVGTALTVYATANFPTHPPALNQQPCVTFQNSSDKVDGVTYSTVGYAAQCPAYPTVNLPSTLPEDTFYSTLKHPQ